MAASKKDVAKQQVKEDREKVREMYLSAKLSRKSPRKRIFQALIAMPW